MDEEKEEVVGAGFGEESALTEKEAEANAGPESDSSETDAVGEACESLGIPDAVKDEGEELPIAKPFTDEGKQGGTLVNVSRDTHNRLKVEKAKSNLKSFDALIRQAFGR